MRAAPASSSSEIRRHGRDSLALYFDVLRDAAPMDRDEETRVAERASHHDQEAVEQLVRANLRFVVSVAKRYRNLGLSLEDLIGEGNLGLLRAAERFDPSRGVRFVSYALWWIRHAMLAALAAMGTDVRRPTHEVMGELRLRRRIDGLRQALGREPTNREVSATLQVDEASVVAQGERWRSAVPLDEMTLLHGSPHGANGSQASHDDATPERDAEIRVILEAALAELPPREKRVLRLTFGLEGDAPPTLAGVAVRLGVSPQRVAAVRDRALSRIRNSRHAAQLASWLR